MNQGKAEQIMIASDNLEVVRKGLGDQLDQNKITKDKFDIELQHAVDTYNKRLVEILSWND